MIEIKSILEPENKYEWARNCSPKIAALYSAGDESLLNNDYEGIRVGIVGTRNATFAGLNDARRIAQVICSHGGIVVSGLAIGIDGSAHQGALDVKGKTIAVLGSGLDIIYPSRHGKMADEIYRTGCLLSEYQPGTKPLAWHFPIRNRIIAAISDVIVVPEGTLKGGARITVDLALGMGKQICALPGPRRNRSSELCNHIIKDGALCITDPTDVLTEIGIASKELGWNLIGINKTLRTLTPIEKRIVEALAQQPMSRSELCLNTNLNLIESYTILKELENDGYITFRRGNFECR